MKLLRCRRPLGAIAIGGIAFRETQSKIIIMTAVKFLEAYRIRLAQQKGFGLDRSP
jgi:hypothetical protein